MRNRIISTLVGSGAAVYAYAVPLAASAQGNLDLLLGDAQRWIAVLVGIIVTVAIVVFFWGLIKYLTTIGGEEKHKGLMIMFYGILTIFVMVALWGLVRFFASTFRTPLDQTAPTINLPGTTRPSVITPP